MLPEIAHQPMLHNPYPQLSKVAVAPFFNLSSEPTLDGHRVALAYYNELQSVPGFEVIPVEVVEAKIQEHQIALRGPADARRLAQILGVDAIVIGAVTDYCPYYPPRCGLQVEWYAANPNFHPIPAGYGLPWGGPEERDIPAPLVFEAEFALAKAQLKTQTPPYEKMPEPPPSPGPPPADAGPSIQQTSANTAVSLGSASKLAAVTPQLATGPAAPQPLAAGPGASGGTGVSPVVGESTGKMPAPPPGLPPNWPDARGFIPPPPSCAPPPPCPTELPVMQHTRTYNGHDMQFTEALSSYYFFRDDARNGGWQSYLQRSDDFLRFCCHLHISEMLSARGGTGETRVVWCWPTIR